jgi:F0F1-type ATP synthase delta subunit
MSEEELDEIAQEILHEALEEIEEEFEDAYGTVIQSEELTQMIGHVQSNVKGTIVNILTEDYQPDMTDVQKMMLGETIARKISTAAKNELQAMLAKITGKALNLVEELRNEVIGEVFEETED